ncbi:MAG: hypothetical protein V1874_04100 [Spirochaetota bacterium]
MAIADLNPVFSEISGRIGSVVFYRRLDKQCLRAYVQPRNPDMYAQRIISIVFDLLRKALNQRFSVQRTITR